MKKGLLQFVTLRCHIRPRFLSHKTGTATKLQQELTMENGNLKHMDGKSCPVILLIEQCKALSLRSRLLKKKTGGPRGANILKAKRFLETTGSLTRKE